MEVQQDAAVSLLGDRGHVRAVVEVAWDRAQVVGRGLHQEGPVVELLVAPDVAHGRGHRLGGLDRRQKEPGVRVADGVEGEVFAPVHRAQVAGRLGRGTYAVKVGSLDAADREADSVGQQRTTAAPQPVQRLGRDVLPSPETAHP